jgi:hypothetical protein
MVDTTEVLVDNTPFIRAQLAILNVAVTHVGVLGKSGSKQVMIATVHEFGVKIAVTPKMRGYLAWRGLHLRRSTTHITIPERSFVRQGFKNWMEHNCDTTWEAQLNRLFAGTATALQVLEVVGEDVVDAIRAVIFAGPPPPLHPFTIAGRKKKGKAAALGASKGPKALYSRGNLVRSIDKRITA